MWVGFLSLFVAVMIGGSLAPLFIKLGVREFPPFTFSALRFIIATIVFLPFYLINKEKILTYRDYKELFLKSLFFVGNAAFFGLGISHTTLIMSQILYALSPILVLVCSYIILGERITKERIIGLVLAFSGVGFLIYQSFINGDTNSVGTLSGNILVFLAVFSYALYFIFSKSLQKKYKTTTISFFNLFVAMIVFIVLSPLELMFRSLDISKITIVGIGSVLGAAIILSALMFFLVQFGIKRTSAFSAALFQYLAPFFASLIAIPVLHERPTIALIFGGMLIIIGVFYATTYHPLKKHIQSVLQ